MELGKRTWIVGTGFAPLDPPAVMVKFTELEVLPRGAGLVTVTATMPVDAIASAGMAAVNCVELTNVVVNATPPRLTIEAAMKFVPVIVSVKAVPPATVLFGEIAVIVGAGFDPLDTG
jgi:hypothetical protein